MGNLFEMRITYQIFYMASFLGARIETLAWAYLVADKTFSKKLSRVSKSIKDEKSFI